MYVYIYIYIYIITCVYSCKAKIILSVMKWGKILGTPGREYKVLILQEVITYTYDLSKKPLPPPSSSLTSLTWRQKCVPKFCMYLDNN